MASMDWEQEFEENVRRERTLVIELLDSARAIHGGFKPSGLSEADAAELFEEKFKAWREAADAIVRLAENHLARR